MPGTSTPDQSKSGAKYGCSQVSPLSALLLSRLRNRGSLGGCIRVSRLRECVNAAIQPPSLRIAIDAWETYANSSLCTTTVLPTV